MNATSPAESAAVAAAPVDYRTEPSRYRHWAYTIDGAVATLTMTVAEDAFTFVTDDEPLVPGDVVISLTRFQAEGDRLLSEGRRVGVRLES